ncbi:MAG: low temperature requirement protein A [Solirubrobacterales bacterium]|nr:low temperature requirement protein A [Solirubrobacterales bacterium]
MSIRRPEPAESSDSSFGTTTFELFFDLVFVFAVTQVSHLLIDDLTWTGALHATIAFLVVWWAWQYTVWMTNELDPDVVQVRLLLILLMLGSLFLAVAIPDAFGDRGLLFAGAYVFIQVARQSYLTFVPTTAGSTERKRSAHILAWFLISGLFWILGATLDGDARVAVWLLALAVDFGAPRIAYRLPFVRPVTLDDWAVGSGHFSERFQAFTIIALGETVVLTGATASGLDLTPGVVSAMVAAFVGTVALWWLYFNTVSTVFADLLEHADTRTAVARDLFTYGHIPIVAGIILCAVGNDLAIHQGGDTVGIALTTVLVAGPVLYLLAYVPARWQVDRSLPRWRIGGAGASLVAGVVATIVGASVLALGVALTLILIAVVAGEFRLPLTVLTDRRSHN